MHLLNMYCSIALKGIRLILFTTPPAGWHRSHAVGGLVCAGVDVRTGWGTAAVGRALREPGVGVPWARRRGPRLRPQPVTCQPAHPWLGL